MADIKITELPLIANIPPTAGVFPIVYLGVTHKMNWEQLNSQITASGANPLNITGTGTTNSIPKWTTGGSVIGDSVISDVAGAVTVAGAATFTGDVIPKGNVRNISFQSGDDTNINAQVQYDQVNANSGQLLFKTANAGTLSTNLTISNTGAATFTPSGGSVVIGSNGHITSTQALNTATAGGRFIGSSAIGVLGDIRIEQTAAGVGGGYIRFMTSPSGSTSPTEKMRISSGGDVGVGTTPNAAGPTWRTLFIGSAGTIISRQANTGYETFFSSNYYINSSNVDSRRVVGGSSRMILDGDVIKFQNAPTGAVNVSPSWTERLTIESGGAVGIDNSSPGSFSGSGSTSSSLVIGKGTSGISPQLTLWQGNSAQATINFASANTGTGQYEGRIRYTRDTGVMDFRVNAIDALTISSTGKGEFRSDQGAGNAQLSVRSNSSTNVNYGGIAIAQNSGGRGGYITMGDTSAADEYYYQANTLTIAATANAGMKFRVAANNAYGINISTAGWTSILGDLNIAQGLHIGTTSTGMALGFSITSAVIQPSAGWYDMRWNPNTGVVFHDGSCRLIKENIIDSPYGLETILKLKPRKYYRIDGKKEEIGFVADEVENIIPELVTMSPKSLFTKNDEDTEIIAGNVDYGKITAVLTKAIQEQQTLINTLTARIDTLENN